MLNRLSLIIVTDRRMGQFRLKKEARIQWAIKKTVPSDDEYPFNY